MNLACFLDDDDPTGLDCYAVAGDGQVRPIPLAEAAAAAGHVTAIVTGTTVLMRTLRLPGRAEERTRMAAAYALEDDLASDPETLHVALGPPMASGERAVAIVDDSRMEAWMRALEAAGLRPRMLVPAYLCLPPESSARLDEIALVRRGDGTGFALERDLLQALPEAPASLPRLDRGDLAARAVQHEGLSLLQGRYRPRLSGKADLTRPALRVAGLAGTALLLWLAATLGEGLHLRALDDHYYRAAQDAAEAVLPEGTMIVDPARQLRQAVEGRVQTAGTGSASGFLGLTALLDRALDDLPAAEVQSLRYDRQTGSLDAEIALAAFADLTLLAAAIRQAGGVLDDQGARQERGQIVSRVRISRTVTGGRP